MFGTASRSKQQEIATAGGVPIDYKSQDFSTRVRTLSPNGVDAVFDAVGGMNWWRSYSVIRRGGILVCYGVSTAVTGGKIAGAASFVLLGILQLVPDGRQCAWYNITKLRQQHPDWFRQDLIALFGLLLQRKIQPVIALRLPLIEAAHANDLIEHAGFAGKIVLLCQE
jgi:NADPH:quinone reductase-like Zn-dependent oxidoreductase